MEIEEICDFCEINNAIGVYACDHGPFSQYYCEECLMHKNIRTLYNGLSKWARLGDIVFNEYADEEWLGCEPNVFFNGEYMSLRDLIKIITVKDVEEHLNFKNSLVDLIIKRLGERT